MSRVDDVRTSPLGSVIRVLGGLVWPVSETQLPQLAKTLGWAVTSAPGGRHVRADTTLPVNRRSATFSCRNGQLTSITFRTSDVMPDDVPGRADAINDAFTDAVSSTSEVLGAPTRRVKSREPEAVWELPNGGRLTVSAIESSVSVVAHSAEHAADLRRLGS